MESDASNIGSVSFEAHHRVWVGGLDVIEADDIAASGC